MLMMSAVKDQKQAEGRDRAGSEAGHTTGVVSLVLTKTKKKKKMWSKVKQS